MTRQTTAKALGHEDNLISDVVVWLSERVTGMVIEIHRELGPSRLDSVFASTGFEPGAPAGRLQP